MMKEVFFIFALLLQFNFASRSDSRHRSDNFLEGAVSSISSQNQNEGSLQNDQPNLRGTDNFVPFDTSTSPLRSLRNYDPFTLFSSGTVFAVVITHLPPWVIIEGLDSSVDPGNLNQTRTYAGGQISGLFIDYLDNLAYNMDVTFEYFYACKLQDITTTGSCGILNWRDSLFVLNGNQSYYAFDFSNFNSYGFAANVGLSPAIAQQYYLTQPILNEGWRIVVKTAGLNVNFMSWLSPFDWTLWIVVLAEIFIAAAIMTFTEGYGTNENIWMSNILATYYDSFYWSFTCLFGAMSQSPSTWAGRTVYVCQLFFGQLLLVLYVGNLVTFLGNIDPKLPIYNVHDMFDTSSVNYDSSHSICIPAEYPSIDAYVQQQISLYPNAKFGISHAKTLDDCLFDIYLGKATTTFYQKNVLLNKVQNYAFNGMCSSSGGYCSNQKGIQNDFINAQDCTCPPLLKLVDGTCQNPSGNVWNPVDGDLVVYGDTFNSMGFSLAFLNPDGQSELFSEAIQWSRDAGILDSFINKVPSMATIYQQCAAQFSTDAIQLDFVQLQGLFTISLVAVFVGVVIGLSETIIDVSIRYCPCLGFLRPPDDEEGGEGGGEGAQDAEDEKGRGYQAEDDAESLEPDVDEKLEALHARIADLARIFDEAAR